MPHLLLFNRRCRASKKIFQVRVDLLSHVGGRSWHPLRVCWPFTWTAL